jgi:hypothetical protein
VVITSAEPPPRLTDAMLQSVVCHPPPLGVDYIPCPVAGCDAVVPLRHSRSRLESDGEASETAFARSDHAGAIQVDTMIGSASGAASGYGSEATSDTESVVPVPVGFGSPAGSMMSQRHGVGGTGPTGGVGLGDRPQAGPGASSTGSLSSSPTRSRAGSVRSSGPGAPTLLSGSRNTGKGRQRDGRPAQQTPATIRDIPVFSPRAGPGTKKGSAVRVRRPPVLVTVA